MSFTTPAEGVPYTSEDPDDYTAHFQGLASNAQLVNGRVIYTAGSFVPGTTGTFPNNYAHTGLAFDAATKEKAAMPLFAPSSWPSVAVSILGLAASFGSGNVRLRLGSEDGDNDVTIAVAASFLGELDFPTPLSWSPGSGALAGLQFSQFPLTRVGDDATNDTLAEDFAVLAVILTNGG